MKKILKQIRHSLGNIKRYFIKKITLIDADLCQKKIQNNIDLIKGKKQIKVAFLHMYATDCQNLCIYEAMLKSDLFDPYFIVNPDIYRSYDNLLEQYHKTVKMLTKKYGSERVLLGYNEETKSFVDYTRSFDVMTTNNPYDVMANKYFRIKYWGKKGIPIFYISYFYMGRCFVTKQNFSLPQFNYIWKIFVENEETVEIAKEVEWIKGKNVLLSGYPKLDEYYSIQEEKQDKKIVILAPHHSINENDSVSVGSFLETNQILQDLPKLFPQIQFVFRPHPLLFEVLKKYWTKNEIDAWLSDFLKNGNVSYSTEGNYLQLFKNSSALIHDCGSYMAEYLYTKKPCAYMYRKNSTLDKVLTSFGKNCIENHYALKEKNDYIDFIQNVVIEGNDKKKNERDLFAKTKVMINYPFAGKFIMDYITTTF